MSSNPPTWRRTAAAAAAAPASPSIPPLVSQSRTTATNSNRKNHRPKQPQTQAPKIEYRVNPLPSDPRRLLILDINGVLVTREPFIKNKQQRGFLKRKYCDEFLDWAFAHFQIGVWSCGKRENMEMELFANRHPLVIEFSQDQSTNLWPQHSVVAPGKPLFLKDLNNVWSNSNGIFTCENTILLDNHEEKFERNPPGTCVLVNEFLIQNSEDDDSELNPDGGPLVSLLTELLNSQLSQKDFALDQAQRGNSLFAFLLNKQQLPSQLDLRREFATLFTSSSLMQKNCPERNVEFYMRYNDTPGPRANPMRRMDLQKLTSQPDTWTACEKSDGLRSFLFIPPFSKHAWFVDRAWSFTLAGKVAENKVEEKACDLFSVNHGGSLLDGEIVKGTLGKGFIVFDVCFLFGEDVGADPLFVRMEKLQRLGLNGQTSCEFSSLHDKIQLKIKSFVSLPSLSQLQVKEWDYGLGIGSVDCDGVVFTPLQASYYGTTVLKFKDIDRLTVDFRCFIPKDLSSVDRLPLKVFLPGSQQQPEIATLLVDFSTRQELVQFKNSEITLECKFNSNGIWSLFKVRRDKQKANHVCSAWSVLESIAENLTFDHLVQACKGPFSSNAAMQHYDERQRERNEGGELDPRISCLRRLNNAIKSSLIESPPLGWVSSRSSDQIPLPNVLKQRQHSNHHQQQRRNNNNKNTISILDIACGRGGDVGKWLHAYKIGEYVGVDISSESLDEAESRLLSSKHLKPKMHGFVHADAGDGHLADKIKLVSAGIFDLISCQFALHYFGASEESMLTFLKEIKSLIKPKGLVLLTLLDCNAVRRCLMGKREWNNSICQIELNQKEDVEDDEFGHSVVFTLGKDAVVELAEPLIPVVKFERVAKEAKLEQVSSVNFCDFVHTRLEKDKMIDLLINMKVLSDRGVSADEWNVCGLYRCVVLQNE